MTEEQIQKIENQYNKQIYIGLIISVLLGALLNLILFFSKSEFLWTYGNFKSSTFLTYFIPAFFIFSISLLLLKNKKILETAKLILLKINKKTYFILFLILVMILTLNLQITIFQGDNWAGHMARVVTGVSRGGDWYIYHLKYYKSNILSAYIDYLVAKAGTYFTKSTFFSLAKLSNVLGVLFILVSGLFVRKFYKNNKLPVFLLLFMTPAIILFFGYVESITVAMIFSLLYFYFAYQYLQSKRGIILPALFLSLAMLSHMANGWLLPSFIYLILYNNVNICDKSIHIKKDLIKTGIIGAIVFLLPFVLSYAFIQIDLKMNNMPFSVFDLGSGSLSLQTTHVPITEAGRLSLGLKYTMFTLRHVIEYISLLFRMFSFYFILLIVLSLLFLNYYLKSSKLDRFKDPRIIFLALAGIFNLIYLFMWPLTMDVRWRGVDPFNLAVIPISLMIAFLIYDVAPNKKIKITSLLLVSIFLFITPWIVFNINPANSSHYTSGTVRGSMGYREVGFLDDQGRLQYTHHIEKDQLIKVLFDGIAGFRKNRQGAYLAEAYIHVADASSGKLIQTQKLEIPFKDIIEDLNNKYSSEFGIIEILSGSFNITNSLPPGEYDIFVEIKDLVSEAQHFAIGNFIIAA